MKTMDSTSSTRQAAGGAFSPSQAARYGAALAALAAAYFLVGHASLLLVMVEEQVKLVWAPSGIALAALWRWGVRLWPGVALGAAAFAILHGMGPYSSAGFVLGGTLEAVVGAALLRRSVGLDPRLERLRDVFGLTVAGAIAAAGAAALFEVAGLRLDAVPSGPATLWWVCWLGRALGILLVVPGLLTWSAAPALPREARRRIELALLAAIVVAVSSLVFGSMAQEQMVSPLPYTLFPLLLWAAVRFGPRETASAMLVCAAFAVWGTANGNGPFMVGSREQNLVSLYLYLAVAAVAAMALAAAVREQKSAERVARDSERQYRTLVESMNEGLVAQDAAGRILFANAPLCELLGYVRDELIGKPVEDIVDPGSRAEWGEQQRLRRSGGGESYELDLRRKDGSILSVLVSPRAVFDEAHDFAGSFALVTDITERRRTDDMLRWIARATAPLTGEEFFRSLMRNLAAAFGFHYAFITECMDHPTTRVRTLAFWNGAQFGPNFEYDLAGTPCEQTIHGGEVCCFPERVGEIFPREAGLKVQGYLGLPVWDSSGKEVIGHVAFLSDGRMGEEVLASPLFQIFASRASAELRRKRAEDVLRESEEKYRLLVENQSDLVVKLDPQRRLLFVSPSFCDLSGHAESELLGQAFRAEVPEEDREASEKAWSALLSPPYQGAYEERVMTRIGWRWIAWSARALLGEDGTVKEIVAAGRDVTERRRAEEQSRQHLQQLAHVARVSALGEMASAIAHEVNQPLTAILTYTQACQRLLAGASPDQGELRHAMGRVAAQADRAGEIIRRLRSFLGKEEVQALAVDVNYLVTEVVSLARPEARQSAIQLRLELAPDLPPVRVDAIQIQQVILNLVRNGLDAINGHDPQERVLTVASALAADGMVTVSVADSGPGVDAEVAQRIFEPFFTTKANGMGIGLAISRSIVEAHNGRLWLDTAARPGAVFRIALPVAA